MPAVIFLTALAVYNRTLTPSLSYSSPDGNELVTICYRLGLAHPTGYPLYTWLGKLFSLLPVGDVAHRVNLMSAVMGAGGVALLYACARLLGLSRLFAAFTALLFAFSRTFWSQTVISEVYAPNVFMLALTLLLLLRWAAAAAANPRTWPRGRFLAFALVFGLSLGTHLSNLGFAPAFAVFVLLLRPAFLLRPVEIALALGAFLLGAAQFLWLPLHADELLGTLAAGGPGLLLWGIYKYTLGAFSELRFAFPLWVIPDRIVLYLELLRQNVTGLGMILGMVGMWAMLFRATRRFYLLMLMYLAHLLFFLQYKAFDLDVFFIPSHLLYCLFVGYGGKSLVDLTVALWHRVRRGEGPHPSPLPGGEGTDGGSNPLAPFPRGEGGTRQPTLEEGTSFSPPPAGEGPRVRSVTRPYRSRLAALPSLFLAGLLFLPVAGQLRANAVQNDRSRDTLIGDFYRNVSAALPPNSVVWTRGAVFAYDIGYYREVYGLRPDVTLPMLGRPLGLPPAPAMPGERVFTTAQPGRTGPFQPPLPPPDKAWYVPVLVAPVAEGNGLAPRELALYRVSDAPPDLAVASGTTAIRGGSLGDLELAGYNVTPRTVSPGQTVQLTYYWRMPRPAAVTVVTRLGEGTGWAEAHAPGFGSLPRYVAEGRPLPGGVYKEEYRLVVPTGTPEGSQRLRVGVLAGQLPLFGPLNGVQYLDLGTLEVQD